MPETHAPHWRRDHTIGEPDSPADAPVVYTNGPVGDLVPGEQRSWASEVANTSGQTSPPPVCTVCHKETLTGLTSSARNVSIGSRRPRRPGGLSRPKGVAVVGPHAKVAIEPGAVDQHLDERALVGPVDGMAHGPMLPAAKRKEPPTDSAPTV